MKSIIIGCGLLIFLVSYNLYIFNLSFAAFDFTALERKAWNYFTLLELCLLLMVFRKGANDFIGDNFLIVGWIALSVTLLLAALNALVLIKNVYLVVKIMDGAFLLATTSIMFSASRHGYFKDEQ